MKCIEKECDYRELNGGDEISDFYFCKLCGITTDRGQEECFMDKFEKEAPEKIIDATFVSV